MTHRRYTEARYEQNLPGCDYSDDEREFIVAMERYKREKRRPFPTCREILKVVAALGYRKVSPPPAG